MSATITISQLTPNFKGNSLLRFQVAEIGAPLAQPHQVNCTIVDQTGCINAYFNNYGAVYELSSFKCKVVEHSLRVELRKDSKITRIKHQLGFKDLSNNLSEKFYVSKAPQKSNQPQKLEQVGSKKQVAKDGLLKNQKEIQKEQKVDNKQSKVQKLLEKADKETKIDESEKQTYKRDNNAPNENQKQVKSDLKKGEPVKKKQYVQKKSGDTKPAEQKEKQNQDQRTLLKDISKFRQQKVNLIVRIDTNTKIDYEKYHLIKVCDSSGSAYIEFQSRVSTEDKSWYHLKNFTVFKDKVYGFIASQSKQSSWQILYDFNEKPDFRPVNFKTK